MDIFPEGWDKTYCLKYLSEFKTIHFFGDKTFLGGNDYEIYSHPSVIGHSVKDYTETISGLKETFQL
jgi:phosphomannomutase